MNPSDTSFNTKGPGLEFLRDSIEAVFGTVDQYFELPENVLVHRLNDSSWSIREVLEHIALANHYLMLTLSKHQDKADRRAKNSQEVEMSQIDWEHMRLIGQRGSFVWPHPEHMTPSGKVDSGEVQARIADQKNRLLESLDQMQDGRGLLCSIKMSVQSLGKINLYQWMYFIVLHAQRHVQQIEEIVEHWKEGSA